MKIKPEDRKVICSLYLSEVPPMEIARLYGYSEGAIYLLLRKKGITRNGTEARKLAWKNGGYKERCEKLFSKIEIRDGLIIVYANNTKRGHIFDFSEELFNKLSNLAWQENTGYLYNGNCNLLAHHLVLPRREGFMADHINRRRWDNRISNLRYVNFNENAVNRKKRKGSENMCVGVCWNKRLSKYVARIGVMGKYVFLGYFANLQDAINARKIAEEKYYPGIRYEGDSVNAF